MENKRRFWDWPSALLVFSLVVVVAARLSVTNWSPNLWMMDILALSGVVLGLLLGASRFRPRTVILLGVVYSSFFVFWQMGSILSEKLDWSDRISFLFERIKENLTLFFQNTPVNDSLLFLFLMGLFIWILAITAGYQASRYGKPWWPLFFLTVLFLVVDYYHPFLRSRNRYTAIYFFLMLVLLSRLFLQRMRNFWARKAILEDAETGIHLSRWMTVASLGLILVAWNLPILFQAFTPGTTVQRQLERSWRQIRDRLSNAVAGLTNPVIQVTNLFGDSIQFGQNAASGDDLLFTVEIPGISRAEETRFYWRAQSYDLYEFAGWRSSTSEQLINPANDWKAISESYGNQSGMTFSITSHLDLSETIIAPGNPINFNRPVTALITPADDGQFDVLGFKADPPLSAGDVYRVQSRVGEPTITQMRESGEDYPEWIKERYLELPESISPRFEELAREITQSLDNPYDKTNVITSYLRKTITYKEVMDRPPLGKDVMEWFLFDYQEGFCNYYASAEVLLLRTLGIPARLSVGFASGEYHEDTSSFSVQRKNGHAWPEVYFAGIGWVEFEPTSAQPERIFALDEAEKELEGSGVVRPPIQLDEGEIPDGQEEKPEGNEVTGGAIRTFTGAIPWILVVFFTIIISLLFFLRFMPGNSKQTLWMRIENYLEKRNARVPKWLANLGSGNVDYRINNHLKWLNRLIHWRGGKIQPGMTITERIILLIQLMPEVKEPALELMKEYELASYSLRTANIQIALKAGRQIRNISIKNLLMEKLLLKGIHK